MEEDILKKLITYIISLLLSLCIFALIALPIFSNTICSKKYIVGVLEKNNYYEKIYEDIKDGFKNYIMQSGLEESILENLYSKEKVKQDINMVLDGIYENKSVHIETETISSKLDNRIDEVLEKNNRIPEAEEKEAIQTFKDAIIDTYVNGIAYSEENIEKIGEIYNKVFAMINKAQIMCAIIILVLVGIIAIINRNLKEFLKFNGIALLTSGLLSSSLKFLIGDRIHYILILNTIFSENIIYVIQEIMNAFLVVGLIAILIGIAMIVIGNWNGKNKE